MSSRTNPKLSVHNCIFGEFNFVAIPLPSPGAKILAHIHSYKRGSWDLNREEGWHVDP